MCRWGGGRSPEVAPTGNHPNTPIWLEIAMDVPAPDPQALLHMLINIATHQLTITHDIRAVLQELRDANTRQASFNEEQVAINARLEKLLQGLLPPSPNGH